MLRLVLHDFIAHLAFRILDKDATLRPLHEHDQRNQAQHQRQNKQDGWRRNQALTAHIEGTGEGMWQIRNDAGKNNQRRTLTNPPLGNLLAQPHQEHGAAGENHHRGEAEIKAGMHHRRNPICGHALKPGRNPIRLQQAQQQRAIARILVDFAPPGFAFLLQRRELRHRDGHQLNNNARGNIRHYRQRKNRHTAQRAAGEHVEHPEHPALMLGENLRQRLRVNPRNRNIGAEAIDNQRPQYK